MSNGDLPFERSVRGGARVSVRRDAPVLVVLIMELEDLVQLSAQMMLASPCFGVTVWRFPMRSWAERCLMPVGSSLGIRCDFLSCFRTSIGFQRKA